MNPRTLRLELAWIELVLGVLILKSTIDPDLGLVFWLVTWTLAGMHLWSYLFGRA
jgi:hypothetical protein